MSEKRPQPTAVLVKRLRRVAKYFDGVTAADPAMAARANTCWQAAARLEEADEQLRALPGITTADDDDGDGV